MQNRIRNTDKYHVDKNPRATCRPPPPESERHSIFDVAVRESHRHKWIESEQAGRDLGDAAIEQWHKLYWDKFVRERWLQHLRGTSYWIELDNHDFARLACDFQDMRETADWIADQLEKGSENLDIIHTAINDGMDQAEILTVLSRLNVNTHRLTPLLLPNGRDFVNAVHANHQPRVIVVDDDVESRRQLRDLLQKEKMEVVETETVEEAMKMLLSRRFDLYIICLDVPGRHGAEMAWYLLRHGIKKNIVAMSAHLDDWHDGDLRDGGFTHLAKKPFDPDYLSALAREVVNLVSRE